MIAAQIERIKKESGVEWSLFGLEAIECDDIIVSKSLLF